MTRPIGYYVHHHGDGHRQRALAIARAAPGLLTLIGTGLAGRTQDVASIDLPDDRPVGSRAFDGRDDAPDRPLALHYAPLDHDGVRRRTALVAAWIEREKPALLIVDVSVEIAMLARLAATPTVYVRLSGLRDDAAHLEAFRGARALLAPFHRDLDEPATPDWVRRKTIYASGLGGRVPAVSHPQLRTILVVYGKGGPDGSGEDLAKAARATPKWRWRAMGPITPPSDTPDNLTLLGWVDDPASEIAAASVVVGAAGDGLVNAVLAHDRPFICLPQSRPFDEQRSKARRLKALGSAIVLDDWPQPSRWPELIAAAQALDPQSRQRLRDPDGPAKAARFLVATAAGETVHGDH